MTTSRREFLEAGIAGGLTIATARSVFSAAHGLLDPRSFSSSARGALQPRYDVVIRGGALLDGGDGAAREVDVAIQDGSIAAISPRVVGRGRDEIDARGMVVSPGFIDIHSHGDSNLDEDPRAESLIRQGITTIVVGADGSSQASGNAPGSFDALFARWNSMKPAVNVASMIGLGTVRGAVVGNGDSVATSSQVQRMTEMVARAVAEGACGASSGLEYTPGAFASLQELTNLCRPLRQRALPYATHMRNEDDRVLDSIDESISVAEQAGCPLQISHLKAQGPRNWDKLDEALRRIDSARARGIDIAFDRYPYLAYSTGLTNLFPVWSRAGGNDAFLARLNDTSTSGRIEAETRAKVDLIGGWDNVLITSVNTPLDRASEGKRLGSYAATINLEAYAAAVALITRSRGSVGMAGFAMSEENLDKILAHPMSMVCTDGGSFAVDGPTRRGSPHPRGIGSFPRVLGRYVRERKALSLQSAIVKMTSLPASRVKLSDRGRIVVGSPADVVVFDPSTVADRATFESPFQYPQGINAVVVNGQIALRDGTRSSKGSGKALRAHRSNSMPAKR